MKSFNTLLFTLILLHSLSAQNLDFHEGVARAVVVGISDYQDENITDLQFADKDALAFAEFLKSPAGGNLEEENLKVLLNEQATAAQFAIALDWLIEETRENDQVIIYFSGHGDVERKTITQPGFLLCWDSPPRVYMAGGTFSLPFLQEVISTLSIQNKAKVLVVTDACRSGKLSGSSIGGTQATTTNLAQQFANEIKILSCQPNEYSIEGTQWGGGRGAFSYHLLDGLYGLADQNQDQQVTLLEIGRYLEDNVTAEVAPQSQIPMTVGARSEKITDVDTELLARLVKNKKEETDLFSAIASRGIEDDILATVDSSIQVLYFSFKQAIKNKDFLSSENSCADFYYKKLVAIPELEKLHSTMRRNYSAALQDDAQQVLNRQLRADVKEGILSNISKIAKYKLYPKYLKRAAELLGEQHYMYPILLARKYYFEGYLISLKSDNPDILSGAEAIEKFRTALTWQPEMPQVYLSMSSVFGYNLLQPDSAEHYANIAASLVPSWAIPYSRTSFLFGEKYKDFEKAEKYLILATQIDSNSLFVLNDWGNFYNSIGEYEKAIEIFKKCIQLDSTFEYSYNNLGFTYSEIGSLDQAEKYFKKAIQLDSINAIAHNNLGDLYDRQERYPEAIQQFEKAIEIDSSYLFSYNNLGLVYYYIDEFTNAETYLKKAIRLDSTYVNPIVNLAKVYLSLDKSQEAKRLFLKAIEIDSTESESYGKLGYIYLDNKNFKKAEYFLKKSIKLAPYYSEPHYNLACLKSLQNHVDEAFTILETALKNGEDDYDWINEDPDLSLLREHNEQWNILMKKYFPDKF